MKDILLIGLLCILATLKVTLQGFFAKKNVKTLPDAVFFNGIIFLFACLSFLKDVVGCSMATIAFGAIFGILTVAFQVTYMQAMSMGNVSLTVMLVNLSMIIPVVFSVIVFRETLTLLNGVGILLILLALVACTEKHSTTGGRTQNWFLWAFAASALNGALAICLKIFGTTPFKAENRAFVAWAYLTAFALSLLLYLVLKANRKEKTFQTGWKPILIGGGAGITLAVFQTLNAWAVSRIHAAVFFPSYNGGSLILSTLSGVLLLKDKLKKTQLLAILLGIAAIVLLNVE